LRCLAEDGLLEVSEQDQLVATFRNLGLSEGEARIAADDLDGPSRSAVGQPASEAELAALRPDPAYIPHVIRKIEEVAIDLRRRDVSADKALQEATFGLMRRMPNDALADWVVRIAAIKWPHLSNTPGRAPASGSTSSKLVRGDLEVCGVNVTGLAYSVGEDDPERR
jgi:hypothetical protein